MADETDLKTHFTTLGLPVEAQAWLLELWNLIHVLDDAFDGDLADPVAVRRATWAIFQNMPLNDFYRQYVAILQPVLVLQLLKWDAANVAERLKQPTEKTYVWRAGYYEVVLMCCHLCGIENAGHACLEMYGETYTEYLEGQKCQGH